MAMESPVGQSPGMVLILICSREPRDTHPTPDQDSGLSLHSCLLVAFLPKSRARVLSLDSQPGGTHAWQ